MNKVKVNICGKIISLNTDNDAEFVMQIADKLDKDINMLLKAIPNLGAQTAAVVCALSAYEELKKAEESIDNIRIQVKEYVDEAGRMRDERDRAVMEADKLRKKLDIYENDIEDEIPYEEEAEQLVLENTITPAVTIPVKEYEQRQANPPRQNRAARRKNKQGKSDDE
ncbi:MAG: cell division protein ZapA [Oscillospiraceae bacterium]|nr:cell division protein ZapA [Oscillospiraceae bacterium]